MVMPLTDRRRFTVDEYHQMVDAGILTEDDRVELLDGEIVEMTPIGSRHAGCVKFLTGVFARAAGDLVVSVQDPLVLPPHWEPEPDLAILRPRADGYRRSHPGADDTLLVIEVADTSLTRDREVKLQAYAAAGVAEAWIVNLRDDLVEVFRGPMEAAYRERSTVVAGETLSPVALPDLTIAVAKILG